MLESKHNDKFDNMHVQRIIVQTHRDVQTFLTQRYQSWSSTIDPWCYTMCWERCRPSASPPCTSGRTSCHLGLSMLDMSGPYGSQCEWAQRQWEFSLRIRLMSRLYRGVCGRSVEKTEKHTGRIEPSWAIMIRHIFPFQCSIPNNMLSPMSGLVRPRFEYIYDDHGK